MPRHAMPLALLLLSYEPGFRHDLSFPCSVRTARLPWCNFLPALPALNIIVPISYENCLLTLVSFPRLFSAFVGFAYHGVVSSFCCCFVFPEQVSAHEAHVRHVP